MSSTLTKLEVNVENFVSCLYLLDGRLSCLTTLSIRVRKISRISTNVDKTVSVISIIVFGGETLNLIDRYY